MPAEAQENEKFEEGNQAFQTIKKKTYHAMAAFNTSTRLFDGLMYLVVIIAGGLFLVYDRINAGDLGGVCSVRFHADRHHPAHR